MEKLQKKIETLVITLELIGWIKTEPFDIEEIKREFWKKPIEELETIQRKLQELEQSKVNVGFRRKASAIEWALSGHICERGLAEMD